MDALKLARLCKYLITFWVSLEVFGPGFQRQLHQFVFVAGFAGNNDLAFSMEEAAD